MATNWNKVIGKKFQNTKELDWTGRYPEVVADGTITAIHDADAVPADLVMVDFVGGKFVETDGEQGFEALMSRASLAARALGSVTSEAKAASSTANGKRGGRPRLVELVYSPVMNLLRDNYANVNEYRSAYRDCCKHYDYKARVEGGWRFFEFETDFETWKKQK